MVYTFLHASQIQELQELFNTKCRSWPALANAQPNTTGTILHCPKSSGLCHGQLWKPLSGAA